MHAKIKTDVNGNTDKGNKKTFTNETSETIYTYLFSIC